MSANPTEQQELSHNIQWMKQAKKHDWEKGDLRSLHGAFNFYSYVPVSAGMELIFFLVAGAVPFWI